MTELSKRPDGFQLAADLARNGALRTTGLYLHDPNLTYPEYEALGVLLGRMHQSLRFAIGDWLLLGEQLFPDTVYQAAEALGISEEGMRDYLRVSEQVPRSIRRERLSWSHHRAVAALETPKAKKEWLMVAERERLSHHQLRDRLRESGAANPTASPSRGGARYCPTCGREL